VLAVEMQAASLFAFAKARKANVGILAHVTNAVDRQDEQFDDLQFKTEQFSKGTEEHGFLILQAMLRAARRYLGEYP
jgi:uridine phosphorylase